MPEGQQEELDWSQALDQVANTISTHERHLRNHAQTISALTERVDQLTTTVTGLMSTMEKTRQYASTTDRHLVEACSNIMQRFETKDEVLNQSQLVQAKLDSLSQATPALINTRFRNS